MSKFISVATLLLLVSCGDDPVWPGKYEVTGDWNLSGPLANNRTVGDAIADLVVEKIIGVAGVPGPLEDTVQELVDGNIRDDIKSVVDANVPAALAPTGSVTQALGASLADVRLESTLELEEGLLPGSVEGKEVVSALEYDNQGTTERVAPSELFPGAGIAMDAEWEGGEEDDGELDIDPHPLNIQYGELVAHAVSHVIDATGQQQLETDVLAAVDCTNIINGILGGEASFDIGYDDFNVSLSTSDLAGACDAARALIEDRVLGMFALDTKVQVGGVVTYADSNGDGKADTLASGADFGGILTVAPDTIAPRVTVSFTATR